MNQQVIAVVGAGRMGMGIAQAFAYAGYPVKLIDAKQRPSEVSQKVLQEAEAQITHNLVFLEHLDILDHQILQRILKRIDYFEAREMADVLHDATVIFEAVPEVLTVKEEVFKAIGSAAGSQALVASTTSTFLSTTLASFYRDPGRFMNTHWLNPAYLIPIVEVSPHKMTTPEATEAMIGLLEKAGKVPIKCSPSPGYIVPRIQTHAMNEAARLVEEGVATPEDIDKASRLGFGLRFAVLGLLEFIDWGGGDILYYASNYLKDALKADRYDPPQIISTNMATGQIGMRSGRGFYNFSDRDVEVYQQETLKKFVDLLQHLGIFNAPEKALSS